MSKNSKQQTELDETIHNFKVTLINELPDILKCMVLVLFGYLLCLMAVIANGGKLL